MTLANEALPELRVWALLVAKPMSAASRRKLEMPKFVTIGYGDRAGYERTPKDVRDAAHIHDAEIKKRGALIGVAAAPVQVRNPLAAGVKTEKSAFMSSALPVAGFGDRGRRSRGGDQDRFENAMRGCPWRRGSLALGTG
jgi:hypothetical protein